jgi:hypothetical protein
MNVFAGADHQSATREEFPDGFRYEPELITPEEEIELLAHISELPFRDFEFHGYKGKRRVVSFGRQYDFGAHELRRSEDIPAFLLELRGVAAQAAARSPSATRASRERFHCCCRAARNR